MSKVSLAGNASGTGIFTIASPNSNTDRTLTLPDNTGTILTSASSGISASNITTGTLPKAQLPAGSVLQVVSTTLQPSTSIITTSTTFITTNFSASIAPTLSTSKVFAIATFPIKVQSGTTNLVTFFRNGSNIASPHLIQHSAAGDYVTSTMQYLDSPASTSSQTYTVFFRSASSSYQAGFGGDNYPYPLMVFTLMEIAV